MFSRKIRLEYEEGNARQPVPLKWLDSFAMRNFTNDPVFDDTLPLADGLLEAGSARAVASAERTHGRLVPAQELPAKR